MRRQSALTADRLRQILAYDPESGLFTWLKRAGKSRADNSWNTQWAGKKAGTLHPFGYVIVNLHRVNYRAHRLAWLYVHGEWPEGEVDHIDRNRANNALPNLRIATPSQNQANRKYSPNASGFKGVYRDRLGRWRAAVTHEGRPISAGTFKKPEDASAAYLAKAREIYGEFATDGR